MMRGSLQNATQLLHLGRRSCIADVTSNGGPVSLKMNSLFTTQSPWQARRSRGARSSSLPHDVCSLNNFGKRKSFGELNKV